MTIPDPHVAPHVEEAQQTAEADQTLAGQVESLRQVVAAVMPELKRVTDEQKDVRNWLTAGGIVVIFVFLVAIGSIILGVIVYNDQSEDDALIAQLQQQQGVTNGILHDNCALYGSFYDFYNMAARAVYPQGPVAYDASFLRLQRSADHANCGLAHVVPGT